MLDNDKRLLGCIPASVQAAKARAEGRLSDEAQIAKLAAPWDKTDKPSIMTSGLNGLKSLQPLTIY